MTSENVTTENDNSSVKLADIPDVFWKETMKFLSTNDICNMRYVPLLRKKVDQFAYYETASVDEVANFESKEALTKRVRDLTITFLRHHPQTGVEFPLILTRIHFEGPCPSQIIQQVLHESTNLKELSISSLCISRQPKSSIRQWSLDNMRNSLKSIEIYEKDGNEVAGSWFTAIGQWPKMERENCAAVIRTLLQPQVNICNLSTIKIHYGGLNEQETINIVKTAIFPFIRRHANILQNISVKLPTQGEDEFVTEPDIKVLDQTRLLELTEDNADNICKLNSLQNLELCLPQELVIEFVMRFIRHYNNDHVKNGNNNKPGIIDLISLNCTSPFYDICANQATFEKAQKEVELLINHNRQVLKNLKLRAVMSSVNQFPSRHMYLPVLEKFHVDGVKTIVPQPNNGALLINTYNIQAPLLNRFTVRSTATQVQSIKDFVLECQEITNVTIQNLSFQSNNNNAQKVSVEFCQSIGNMPNINKIRIGPECLGFGTDSAESERLDLLFLTTFMDHMRDLWIMSNEIDEYDIDDDDEYDDSNESEDSEYDSESDSD